MDNEEIARELKVSVRQVSRLQRRLIERLSKSPYMNHKELYYEIIERGKTSVDDAEILGVVVHGTKEEIEKLVELEIIKASTFGVIIDQVSY